MMFLKTLYVESLVHQPWQCSFKYQHFMFIGFQNHTSVKRNLLYLADGWSKLKKHRNHEDELLKKKSLLTFGESKQKSLQHHRKIIIQLSWNLGHFHLVLHQGFFVSLLAGYSLFQPYALLTKHWNNLFIVFCIYYNTLIKYIILSYLEMIFLQRNLKYIGCHLLGILDVILPLDESIRIHEFFSFDLSKNKRQIWRQKICTYSSIVNNI